ncbi:MAG: phosphoglucosamine mutase, partial [Candidatus Coproplasma sp.]
SAVAAKLVDNGRILVRESGTEPLIRVMVEAQSKKDCEELAQSVVEVINSKGYVVE